MAKLEVGMMVECCLQLMVVTERDDLTVKCIWFNTEGELQQDFFPIQLLMAVRLENVE